ncbi:cellulase family glycosylhydrolase [Paenibacillus xylaniclasticus]|uniref:cellulase family glycosylhydrolase n=1 Tax=Paenibacillus xylaniclasticus TaxID=588083 RepID=UPI000FD9B22B|nr:MULTISPECIES: cellulase family glycosylhydrolase [Paenibacillus]GFN30086.1 cellulase family glycosylhydrolase [Paenibacillus curdlanolyticus]
MSITANKKGLLMLLALTLVLSLLLPAGKNKSYAAGPIVPTYGQIKVSGNQLVSQSGQPIQLKGASSHGIQYFGNYVNKNVIKWLRDDWGATVYRAAMYTEEEGYITNPSLKNKVKEAVEAAIDLGIYVIIDWHILSDGDPNKHKSQAIAFFQEMATLYGSYPNVIYEIANEPNGVSWNGSIRPYAQDVITAIRAIDPDNIIIVGTPTWSQDVDHAADNPLPFSNIMYSLHFYAGTHGQYLRDKVNYALNKGIAIFSTEWGTSTATGDGGPYLSESTQWLNFLDSKKISWVNWSIATKNESSAALLPSASVNGGWALSDLSTSGQYVRSKMLEGSVPQQPQTPAAPTSLSVSAGNGQATLTWAGSSGATSYNVKRSTTSGGPYTTVATGVSGTSYTNTGLTNGTTYYYVVSAVNSAGESANSAQASVTPAGGTNPPTNPSGALEVQYKVSNANATDNMIYATFNIKNTGTTAVNLSNLKLRYYLTKDSNTGLSFWTDYAQIGTSNVSGSFNAINPAKTNADTYLELSFSSAAGSIPAGGQTGDIQIRIAKNDWSNLNENNDYSFDGTKTSFASWNKVTLYQNGTLVWGIEP